MVADLAEDLERGVEDALLGALAPDADARVVGERRPTSDRGVGTAASLADGHGLALLSAAGHGA